MTVHVYMDTRETGEIAQVKERNANKFQQIIILSLKFGILTKAVSTFKVLMSQIIFFIFEYRTKSQLIGSLTFFGFLFSFTGYAALNSDFRENIAYQQEQTWDERAVTQLNGLNPDGHYTFLYILYVFQPTWFSM